MFKLETPRLILRELSTSDAAASYALNADPLVIKYTGDKAFDSVAEARDFLSNYDPYTPTNMGRWAVIVKETGENIGFCGLKYHPETDEVDLGYRLLRKEWGKGYATEASQVCLQYGFEVLGLPRIYAQAALENTASIGVMKKLGMTFVRNEGDCAGYPSVFYEIRKEDFRKG
ncbi:MAG: hypothetical protein RI894_1381 [Bacteroidota bacterium]|jgi:RimJ/RimL family protein N-acetyltransferase